MEKENIYELSYLLLPQIPEEGVASVVSNLKEIIEKSGNLVVSEDYPKMIPLSYQMVKNIDNKNQKFDHAYFGWVKFELKDEVLESIQSEVEKHKDVLRFLIVKTVREETTAPKPIIKKTDKTEEKPEKIDEAQIDKSIDELVTEE